VPSFLFVCLTSIRTPLTMLHMLFMRVPEDIMAVTRESRLAYIIHRSDLISFLERKRRWCTKPSVVGCAESKVSEIDIENEWETSQCKVSVPLKEINV
jgi:hypothetical protein